MDFVSYFISSNGLHVWSNHLLTALLHIAPDMWILLTWHPSIISWDDGFHCLTYNFGLRWPKHKWSASTLRVPQNFPREYHVCPMLRKLPIGISFTRAADEALRPPAVLDQISCWALSPESQPRVDRAWFSLLSMYVVGLVSHSHR